MKSYKLLENKNDASVISFLDAENKRVNKYLGNDERIKRDLIALNNIRINKHVVGLCNEGFIMKFSSIDLKFPIYYSISKDGKGKKELFDPNSIFPNAKFCLIQQIEQKGNFLAFVADIESNDNYKLYLLKGGEIVKAINNVAQFVFLNDNNIAFTLRDELFVTHSLMLLNIQTLSAEKIYNEKRKGFSIFIQPNSSGSILNFISETLSKKDAFFWKKRLVLRN